MKKFVIIIPFGHVRVIVVIRVQEKTLLRTLMICEIRDINYIIHEKFVIIRVQEKTLLRTLMICEIRDINYIIHE